MKLCSHQAIHHSILYHQAIHHSILYVLIKHTEYRKLKSIDITKLKEDIRNSQLYQVVHPLLKKMWYSIDKQELSTSE